MKSIITLVLLLLFVLGIASEEDDIVFDDTNEEYHEKIEKHMEKVKTTVGHFFELQIPSNAFGENGNEVLKGENEKELPKWLGWKGNSTLLGVPSTEDIGQHNVSNLFTIEVTPEIYEEIKQKKGERPCTQSETLMTILLDAEFDELKAVDKARALMNLAGVANLHRNTFSMHALKKKEECGSKDSKVIEKGAGNVKHGKGKRSCIRGQVGCDGTWWNDQKPFLDQIKEQNNALAEILQISVLRWEVKADTSNFLRSRRETGSGDYGPNGDNDEDYDNETYDYDSYDDAEREDNEGITEPPKPFVPSASEPRGFGESTETEHPHRHHHGEESIGIKAEENIDEDDIVPVMNPKVESISNTTSLSMTPESRLTTNPQTTPETTLSTTLSTTMSSIPSTTQIVVSSTTPYVETTIGSQLTTNLVESSPTTIETTKTDVVQETTVMTNRIDDGSGNTYITVTPSENDTLSSTQLTTTLSNSVEVVTMSTEKQEINVTIDESSPSTELPTSATPLSIITSESTSKSTLYSTTENQTEKSTTVPTMLSTSTTTTTPEPTTISTMPVTTTTTSSPSTMPPTTATIISEPPRISTEPIDLGVKNYAPRQDKRLKKVQVTAGKPLSFVIPPDTFSDIEDGNTRNLRLSLYYEGRLVDDTHWLQLNSRTQEIYGLPLEKDISIWDYKLVASDREGLNVSEDLDIHVQQHKQSRSVNHQFSMLLKIEKRSNFHKNIDWELKVIQSLTQLYGDQNANEITVRSIGLEFDQANFTWSNDSVPRINECPKDEINKLLAVLVANRDGDPSAMLQNTLAPEIRAKRVVLQGIHQCEGINKIEVPKIPTPKPKFNEQPMPRNQVDQINATVGQLLVFQVPDDTFYDKEDGSARKLNMTLLTIDQTPILPSDWLQFDSRNQEFYGIPLQKDYEKHPRREYQLVVADKEGQTALDGLVVVIHAPTEKAHAVEFSMTLDVPYESFANSARKKRTFIEKLAELFHDKDTNMISLNSITPGSTVVTWRNVSLPTSPCPNDEIARLMAILSNPENGVSERVDAIMGSEFPVAQFNRKPMGQCQDEMPNVHTPDSYAPPSGNSRSVNSTGRNDYLITFILPAIIIASMVLLAGIIALVLYRRRRSGKMTVSEHDDERQSFRSKGIPVIFQDELEEKPDPGNKSPVILKEEKPPLPPPEYQKSDDGATEPMLPKENSEEPYQPPPPFARTSDNNRQNRPKPTPTYRKPPPYVPP